MYPVWRQFEDVPSPLCNRLWRIGRVEVVVTLARTPFQPRVLMMLSYVKSIQHESCFTSSHK